MKTASSSPTVPECELAQASPGGRLTRSPSASARGALAGILALVLTVSVAGVVRATQRVADSQDPVGGARRTRVIGVDSPGPRGRSAPPGLGVDPCPACDPIDSLSTDNFSRPDRIDNKWYPVTPGDELVYTGVMNRDGTPLPHNVIFTVTNLRKNISGIPCVVIWDRDINEGDLKESELAFFAQDDDGNVWNFGEYPEDYEQGILLGAENTWINGVENAQGSVIVQDHVRLGVGYLQAIAPENDFWDCGMAFEKAKKAHDGDDGDDDDSGKGDDQDSVRAASPPVCGPTGCYKKWLVVREWAPLDGCGDIQIKTYAKHVGVVQVGALNDPEGETLVLSSITHLSPEALAEIDRQALEQDARGPTINEIYATTEPAYAGPPLRHKHHDDDDAARIANAAITPAVPLHSFMRIGPNPVSTTASIDYSVMQSGMVELSIYDVSGRRIRSLVSGATSAGTFRIDWDARNDGGQGVANGIYFAKLRTSTQTLGKTIVIAR